MNILSYMLSCMLSYGVCHSDQGRLQVGGLKNAKSPSRALPSPINEQYLDPGRRSSCWWCLGWDMIGKVSSMWVVICRKRQTSTGTCSYLHCPTVQKVNSFHFLLLLKTCFLSCFFFSLFFLVSASLEQGKISVWSDSTCGHRGNLASGERNSIALNYGLRADICSTPGAIIYSYRILQRPTCTDGTVAAFAFFHGDGCRSEGFGPALNAADDGPEGLDGLCLAMVEFKSMAFICVGIGKASIVESLTSTSHLSSAPSGTFISSIALVLATPFNPGQSMKFATYATQAGSSYPSSFPSNIASSIRPVASSTLLATPSPFGFAGAAFRPGGSVTETLFVLGGTLLLLVHAT